MAMALALSCVRRQRGKKGGGGGGDCGGGSPPPPSQIRPDQFAASFFLAAVSLRAAVLAFLVLFLWFTLLYFIRSLWNKDINGETFERSSNDHGSDADKRLGEGVAEEGKAEKKTLKISSEDCARRFEIEEVLHVNSDDSQNLPSMVSSDGCLNCKMHTDDEKLIKEVTVFEIKRRESGAAIVCSDGLSQKRQPRDMSIDWFEEETKSGDIIKSDIFYQQQEIHKVVVSDDNKPPEVLFLSGKQTVSSSGEFSSPNENGTSGFPFDSVCEDKNGTVAYPSVASHYNIGIEDDKCEDHTDNNIEEASSIASTNCGSADKHQTIQVLPVCLANGDNIDDVASLGSSICEDVEDKDNKSNANCISEGAPHGNGMPLVRSPASWWNLCGVIDVCWQVMGGTLGQQKTLDAHPNPLLTMKKYLTIWIEIA
uniref:Uncharacterized protein n=1 Tax=Oryza rufipogon TaxID=4529 RepID=A0A0E0PJY3_ORYRU